MTCQDYEIDLGDYVDGMLGERARAACDAHLLTCARCRALLVDLENLCQAVRTLEPEVPAPHVWTKIAAAIDAKGGGGLRGWGFTFQTLAAACVTVVLVASLSWVGTRLAPVNGQAGRLVTQVSAPDSHEETSVKAEFDFAEAQFTSAIAGLESITQTEQSSLDTGTADVLRTNLSVIDGAISESRAALETEPESEAAQESLFEALRSKVELLQDMVALINEMRKGNQEGAARIVSGLNQ
jgi:anti-sigma factor RsiW